MRATYQQLLVIFIFSLVRILSAEANGHSSLLSNHLRTLSTDHHDSITPHDLDGESQEQDGRVGNVHKYYRMQSARRLATASVSKTPSKSTSLSRTSSRTPTPSRSFSQSSGASPSSTPTISVSATGTLSPLSQAGKGNSASAASSGAVLGTSGVIGVSVAVVLGTLLVCGIVVYFVLKRYNNHKSEPQRAWGHAISDGSGTSPREMRASPAWRTAQHAPLGTHRQSDVLLAPSDAHIGSDTPMHASQLDRADAQQVHPVSVTQPIGAHDWHELPEPADAQDALRELRALQAEIQRIQYQRDRGVSPPPDPYEQAVPAELLLGRRARVVGAASHTSSLSSNSIVVTSVNEEPAVPHSRDSDAGSDAVTLCPDVLADYVKDARAADIVAMQHVIDAEIQRRERDLKVLKRRLPAVQRKVLSSKRAVSRPVPTQQPPSPSTTTASSDSHFADQTAEMVDFDAVPSQKTSATPKRTSKPTRPRALSVASSSVVAPNDMEEQRRQFRHRQRTLKQLLQERKERWEPVQTKSLKSRRKQKLKKELTRAMSSSALLLIPGLNTSSK